MASTDARPVPIKNTAYRHYFEFRKADGTIVTTVTGADSEVSKDGAAFADCTNEFTEIGTTGVGYVDLTSTEMNADAVVLKATCTNTDALPTIVYLYPQETGDIKIDVQSYLGTASPAADTAGYPKVTVKSGAGTGEISLSSGQVALSTSANNAIADAVWDEDITTHRAINSAGLLLQPIHSGTCQAGGSTTSIVLAAGASASDDYYNNSLIEIHVAADGTNKVARFIDDYDGATRTATVATMPVSPGATYNYVVKGFGAIAGATAPTASDNAAAVWNALRASFTAAGSFGQSVGGQISHAGTAQAGTLSSVTLASAAEASTNNLYRYHQVEIIGGTGAGQVSYATGYTAASRVLAVDPPFAVAPDSTSVYALRKVGLDAATPAIVADAVWDEARSGHAVAGTFGEYVFADAVRLSGDATAADNAEAFFDGTGYAGTNNVIPSVTTVTGNVNGNVAGSVGSVTGAVGSVTGAVGSVTGNVGGNVVGSVGSVAGNVGGNVVGSVGSVTAGVTVSNAGIDALFTRQLTESYAADGAAPTVAQALMMIQQMLGDFAISGTTLTVRQLDGTTTAATFTLNDGSAPSALTRAT
jgi:hypothetical protein